MSENLNPVSSEAAVSRRWYFSMNGQPVGPFEFSALAAMWENRQIAATAFLFQEGSAGWVPVSQIFRVTVPPPLPRAVPPQTARGKSGGSPRRKLLIAGALCFAGFLFLVLLMAALPGQNDLRDSGQTQTHANFKSSSPLKFSTAPDSPPPPAYSLKDVKVLRFNGRKDGFGIVMVADITIQNTLNLPIKDIELLCLHSAPSGTIIDKNETEIYQRWNPAQTRTLRGHNVGLIRDQVAHSTAAVTAFTVILPDGTEKRVIQ